MADLPLDVRIGHTRITMGWKQKIYDRLVRSDPRIRREYERYVMEHLEEHRTHRWRHWRLLLALHWHYHIRKRTSPYLPQPANKPQKPLVKKTVKNQEKAGKAKAAAPAFLYPQSHAARRLSPQAFARQLARYDVISFDLFDTLVFRSTASPLDVFWLVGEELYISNYRKIRHDIEVECRQHSETGEVSIEDIYRVIEERFGVELSAGVQCELEMEYRVCFANPYMKAVVEALTQMGRRMIVTSNMYLHRDQLQELLKRCGYALDEIYVSCDMGCSKRHGQLQRKVNVLLGHQRVVHVGNHYRMDVEGSRMAGWSAYYYPNVNELGKPYLPKEMSVLCGSVYAALVNTTLMNGLPQDPYYEYGYAYVGYLVVGFLQWIDRLVRTESIDKLLFVARDMDVVYRAYQLYAPSVPSAYVKASRTSSIHLSFERHIDHFFDWHIRRRISSVSTLAEVLEELELNDLLPYLDDFGLSQQEVLTRENAGTLKQVLYAHRDQILADYAVEMEAAKRYYGEQIGDAKHICFVDLGWKGSTSNSLEYFLKETCGRKIQVSSALLGTEGHPFVDAKLDQGKFHSYIFSSQENADIMRVHNRNGNIWRRIYEILFTSKERSLLKFTLDENDQVDFVYLRKELRDPQIIDSLQQGILDFVRDYRQVQERLGHSLTISARDAYRPLYHMLHETAYNFALFQDFEVCFIAGNVARENAETFRDVVWTGGK